LSDLPVGFETASPSFFIKKMLVLKQIIFHLAFFGFGNLIFAKPHISRREISCLSFEKEGYK
jgi:hypothetical protein